MSRRCRILAIDRSFLLPNSTLVVITFPPSNLSSFATCGSPPLHSSVPCFYPRGYFRLPGHRYTKSVDRRMSPFTDSHTDPVVTVIQWYARSGEVVCYLPSQLKGWKGYCLSPSYRTPLAPCISPQSETQEFSGVGRGRQGTLGQGHVLGHFDR